MIIHHNNWHDTQEFDNEWKIFHNLFENFEKEIKKNNCTLTTSADYTMYSISKITDKNYYFDFYLGKSFYDNKYGLYQSYSKFEGETDLDKIMTSLENIMLSEDIYEKFKKSLEKNGFEYKE